jgi:phosphatidylserine decarboxylase
MAPINLQNPIPAQAVQPASVQPGGGLCMNLELAWGRWRRAWLRRFRPGYVQAMARKRLGQCPDCPHDIIDARDLKFFQNVCGYRFREEDDAWRWRGRLGLARCGLAEVVCFSLVFLAATSLMVLAAAILDWAFWLSLPVILFFWFETVCFFRDPERRILQDPNLLLSPADGKVTHLEEVDDPDFPGGRAFRISIFLSVFDVHVNRIPRTGRVVNVRYFPGAFLDARSADCPARNEQLWIDLVETDSERPVRIKQISGAIARRIVCRLKIGEEVRAGERFGMIKFGSRTDVLIPGGDPVDVNVKVGDHVLGGATVLLQFRKSTEEKRLLTQQDSRKERS